MVDASAAPPERPLNIPQRRSPVLWVSLGGLAVLVLVGIVLLFTLGKTSTPPASHANQTNARSTGSTSNTGNTGNYGNSGTTSPTQAPSEQSEAQSLSSLLTQSQSDRSAIVGAVDAIASCGDVEGAETTLTQSASNRQSLLSQLQSLDLSALPSSTPLTEDLIGAWNNSIQSDQSYAAWASDELDNGCSDNDTYDSNYQAAQGTDAASTQNKAAFAALWNPIASQYGLPTLTQASF
jgi:hypothetical protein